MEELAGYCSSSNGSSVVEADGDDGRGRSSDSDSDGISASSSSDGAESVEGAPPSTRPLLSTATEAELPSTLPPSLSTMDDPRLGAYNAYVYIPVRMPVAVGERVRSCLEKLKGRFPELQLVPEVGAFLKARTKGAGSSDVGEGKDGEEVAGEKVVVDAAALLSAEYHVSLSRAVLIKYGQIEALVSELRDRLRVAFPPQHSDFLLDLGGQWTVFANDDCSKSFVSLSLGDAASHGFVLRGIRATNEAFFPLGLPLYYHDPQPHVSLAWAPGDVRNELRAALAEEESEAPRLVSGDWTCRVRDITCIVGCRFWKVWSNGDDPATGGERP